VMMQPLPDRVGGAGHRALGHVLEPITCTGRKCTDDNGDSVKLARIHGYLQFKIVVTSIVPRKNWPVARAKPPGRTQLDEAALQRTVCRTGIGNWGSLVTLPGYDRGMMGGAAARYDAIADWYVEFTRDWGTEP